MLELVDSHCHLDMLELDGFANGLDDVIAAAQQQAVKHFLCVSVTTDRFPVMQVIAQRYPNVSLSYGVHPNEQDTYDPTLAELITACQAPEIVAVGETGLDYYYNEGDLNWQQQRFCRHIEAAQAVTKPLIIHCRDAFADTYALLADVGVPSAGAVMHCFTGDWSQAKRALDMGLMISFSGILTFKNAKALQDAAKQVPLDRMLIETDAPYLAPVPMRGKPNYPAYVRYTAEVLADIKQISLSTLAAHTTENFFKLFPV